MAIKGWKNAHSDMMRYRREASNASKSVMLHQLNKDGRESGMATARSYHGSEEEAEAHVANMRKMNPNSNLRYQLYVKGEKTRVLGEAIVNESYLATDGAPGGGPSLGKRIRANLPAAPQIGKATKRLGKAIGRTEFPTRDFRDRERTELMKAVGMSAGGAAGYMGAKDPSIGALGMMGGYLAGKMVGHTISGAHRTGRWIGDVVDNYKHLKARNEDLSFATYLASLDEGFEDLSDAPPDVAEILEAIELMSSDELNEALGAAPSMTMAKPKPAVNMAKPPMQKKTLQTPTIGKPKMKMEHAELSEARIVKHLNNAGRARYTIVANGGSLQNKNRYLDVNGSWIHSDSIVHSDDWKGITHDTVDDAKRVARKHGISIKEHAELAETAYEKDLDETKPIVVHGVKGAKSKPFKKKFRNMKHFETWHEKQDGDADVTHVRNEDIEMDTDAEVVAEGEAPFNSPGEAILAAVIAGQPAAVQEIFDAAIRERLTDMVDEYKHEVVAPSLLGVQSEAVEPEMTIVDVAEALDQAFLDGNQEAAEQLAEVFLEMLDLDADELESVMEGKDDDALAEELAETVQYVLDNPELFIEGARFQRLKQAWKDTSKYAEDDIYDEDRPDRGDFGMRGTVSALSRSLAHPAGKAGLGNIAAMAGNPGVAFAAWGAAAAQKGVRVAKRYQHLKRNPKAPISVKKY